MLPPHILSQIWNGAHAGNDFGERKNKHRVLNAEFLRYHAKSIVGSFISYFSTLHHTKIVATPIKSNALTIND